MLVASEDPPNLDAAYPPSGYGRLGFATLATVRKGTAPDEIRVVTLVHALRRGRTVGRAPSSRLVGVGSVGEGAKQVVDRWFILDIESSSLGDVSLLV